MATVYYSPLTIVSSSIGDEYAVDISENTWMEQFSFGGTSLSISAYYETIEDSYDNNSFFYAMDVIFNSSSPSSSENYFVADHCSWQGTNLSVSWIDNRYYLDVVHLSDSANPSNLTIIGGVPMATGEYNELIVNATNYTMSDIEYKSNGDIDIANVMIGGVPLSAGRVGTKYYLIVHPAV